MEALQRVKLDGFQMVISELELEQDYLRREALPGGMSPLASRSAGSGSA